MHVIGRINHNGPSFYTSALSLSFTLLYNIRLCEHKKKSTLCTFTYHGKYSYICRSLSILEMSSFLPRQDYTQLQATKWMDWCFAYYRVWRLWFWSLPQSDTPWCYCISYFRYNPRGCCQRSLNLSMVWWSSCSLILHSNVVHSFEHSEILPAK